MAEMNLGGVTGSSLCQSFGSITQGLDKQKRLMNFNKVSSSNCSYHQFGKFRKLMTLLQKSGVYCGQKLKVIKF